MTVSVEASLGSFDGARLPERYSQQCRVANFLRAFLIRRGKLEIEPIPERPDPMLVRDEVRKFQALTDALLLGLPFELEEDTEAIEQRIWEIVPKKLSERGVVEGAKIQTNFEPDPDVPRLVVKKFEPAETTVELKSLVTHDCDHVSAVNLAIAATTYRGPQSQR